MIAEKTEKQTRKEFATLLKIIKEQGKQGVTELINKGSFEVFKNRQDRKFKLISAIEKVERLIAPAALNNENENKVQIALVKVLNGFKKIKQLIEEQKNVSLAMLKDLLIKEQKIVDSIIENLNFAITPTAILDLAQFDVHLKYLQQSSYLIEALVTGQKRA